MSRVVILQEYVPQYRVPFFDLLHDEAKNRGIDLRVAYGAVGTVQAARNDAMSLGCGISIHQKEWRLAGRRLVVRNISEVISGADMVILEQARRNLDAYKLLAIKGQGGPLIALWGHGRDYTRHTTALDRGLSRWLTAKADWFFAYTEGGAESVIKNGFPSNRSTVVQNSIDATSLRARVNAVDPHSIAAYAQALDLRGKTALFIGALDSSKRLAFLEQASRIANEQDSDFRLLIAGEGPMRAYVEDCARRHSWLTYLGPLTGSEKALAMASSQILAMPGRVGLVAVDSFASARPIFTTSWPWHAPEFEYLHNGHNAVVTDDEPFAYAKSMVEAMNDEKSLGRLQRAAGDDAQKFTIQTMVTNFLDGIQGALMHRNS